MRRSRTRCGTTGSTLRRRPVGCARIGKRKVSPTPLHVERVRTSKATLNPAEQLSGVPPPAELVPTPDQQPRPRRQRQHTVAAPVPSPSPPLTALQRLSLARKEKARSAASTPEPLAPSPSATPPPDGKPMSKLALLAQKRREQAAQQEASTSGATTPVTPVPAVVISEDLGAAKPLSKLQQKLAAARAARADTTRAAEEPQSGPEPVSQSSTVTTPSEEPVEDAMWSLSPPSKSPAAPSTFFSLLTTHKSGTSPPPEPPSLENMHIVVRGDAAAAHQRVREAFGPGVESPDDIVLRTRDGRAGTGSIAPGSEAKPLEAKAASAESEGGVASKEATGDKPKAKATGRPQKAPVKKTSKPPSKPPVDTKSKAASKPHTSKAANIGPPGPKDGNSKRSNTATAESPAEPPKPKPAHPRQQAKPKPPPAPKADNSA